MIRIYLSSILAQLILLTSVNAAVDQDASEGSFINCAICLDAIEPESKLDVTLLCQHRFHKPCIKSWLNDYGIQDLSFAEIDNRRTCPVCKNAAAKFTLFAIENQFFPLYLEKVRELIFCNNSKEKYQFALDLALQAYQWSKKEASGLISFIYLKGLGTDVDLDLAMKYAVEGYLLGDILAKKVLAHLHEEHGRSDRFDLVAEYYLSKNLGLGLTYDVEKAFEFAEKAYLESDDPQIKARAAGLLAYIYVDELSEHIEDEIRILQYAEEAYNSGFGSGGYVLAIIYQTGQAVVGGADSEPILAKKLLAEADFLPAKLMVLRNQKIEK